MNGQVSFLGGRCGSVFSGRLERPADDYGVRIRLPVGQHRPLTLP